MIDLHTHLLPYMDDGAKNLEEALQMTGQLWKQGVEGAACTSHFDPSAERMDDYLQRRDHTMKLMCESKITLYPASETYLHKNLLYYGSIAPLCIANTRYLLLELPYVRQWGKDINVLLDKLIIRYDIIPIIAHAERYPASNVRNIRQLKELGCVIQLNSSSLQKKEHRKKMLKYLKTGLADVLGSDCHDLIRRPPQLSFAYEMIKPIVGQQNHQRIIQNAQLIVQGKDIRLKPTNTTIK